MTWCQSVVDKSGTGGQRQRVLRDIILRTSQQQVTEVGEFSCD